SRTAGTLIAAPRADGPLDANAVNAARQRCRDIIATTLRRFPIDVVHMHGVDFHEYLPPPGIPVLVTLHLPLAWYPTEALRPSRPETFLHCVSRTQQAALPRSEHMLAPIECGVPVASAI